MLMVLKKSDVEKVMEMKDFLDAVETAFRMYGQGKVQLPPKSYLYFKRYYGDLRSMPSYIEGDVDIAGIKSVNVHPNNPKSGLPTVMAAISLTDPRDGRTIAFMDGTYITNMRTGAAGGIATKYLALNDAKVASFIGAGVQASTQLEALMLVRNIKKVKIYDINPHVVKRFIDNDCAKYDLEVEVCDNIEQACKGCQVINTTTPSRTPLVMREFVDPGTHINAIGADAEGKQELSTDLVLNSKIIIDEWTQASHSGEINVPVHEGKFNKDMVYAELGEIVAGLKPARKSENDITIFDSTGLSVQDIMSAFIAYKKVKESGMRVLEIDLLE